MFIEEKLNQLKTAIDNKDSLAIKQSFQVTEQIEWEAVRNDLSQKYDQLVIDGQRILLT